MSSVIAAGDDLVARILGRNASRRQDGEAPLDVSPARRAFIALQWAVFWCAVGLLEGAGWGEALRYGVGVGFCLGWVFRVEILRCLWWKSTFRSLQLWRHFDWRRYFL